MARPIVLSNGRMHIGINIYGEVHDFYYPYVGHENHAAAKSLRHRVGVWVEGRISWLDDGGWEFVHNYHGHSLIGYIKAHHQGLNIALEFDDCVDSEQDVFIRNIHVINNLDRQREIRLFMHQVFDISDSSGNGDTVQYLPDSKAILTYRGRRAFVVSGHHEADRRPFDQHSVGLFGIEGHSGTYADAEDGLLSNNDVEHGRVDSTIGFNIDLPAHSSARVHYWVTAGRTERDALDIDKSIREEGGHLNRILRTSRWWHEWLAPAEKFAADLSEEYRDVFIKNVMLIKAHIDRRGAVIASTDTTMLNYSRDAYAYCWPRDAAYSLWPLVRLGYRDEPEAFFEFCRRVLHPGGYLMHKYQPDGALGSSWHSYRHDGAVGPPIQEDETAIVLFLFSEYYNLHKDHHLLTNYYEDFLKPMADFLASYIDETTGLPRPSYDLWEETFLTTTYTTSLVYAALLAAADLAQSSDDEKSAVRWRTSAEDVLANAHKHLYNAERGIFYKGLKVVDGVIEKNDTVDASAVFGSFMFGLFPFNGLEINSSIETMVNTLKMPQPEIPGLARYENDHYNRVSNDITGNPWFITSLWLAQYYLEVGKLEEAKDIIDWTVQHALPSGVLPEQLNPYTNKFVSVAPLTWSQAELVSTLLDFNGDSSSV